MKKNSYIELISWLNRTNILPWNIHSNLSDLFTHVLPLVGSAEKLGDNILLNYEFLCICVKLCKDLWFWLLNLGFLKSNITKIRKISLSHFRKYKISILSVSLLWRFAFASKAQPQNTSLKLEMTIRLAFKIKLTALLPYIYYFSFTKLFIPPQN